VHAFPFRLTADALARQKGHKWHRFWTMLKPGYDAFERETPGAAGEGCPEGLRGELIGIGFRGIPQQILAAAPKAFERSSAYCCIFATVTRKLIRTRIYYSRLERGCS
jgi:hypothetical protein